jgi:hypothetical protein
MGELFDSLFDAPGYSAPPLDAESPVAICAQGALVAMIISARLACGVERRRWTKKRVMALDAVGWIEARLA